MSETVFILTDQEGSTLGVGLEIEVSAGRHSVAQAGFLFSVVLIF